MNYKASLTYIFLLGFYTVNAQVQQSGWFGSFNTFKINQDFSLHFDAQIRSTDDLHHIQTILLRPGLNYHISKKFTLTGGYALIPNRRVVGDLTSYSPEHRIWQQAIYAQKLSNISIAHRLRFEQRFLPVVENDGENLKVDSYNNAYRLRYFIRNVVPLNHEKNFKMGWFVALQDELFLNTGDKSNVNGKTFDQNRFYAAFGYRFPLHIDLEAGYMNQYVKTKTAFINNHIIQLAVYKRL